MKELIIKGYKDLDLYCYLFEPETKAKGVVQIIHGMQEHALRYKNFAEFLIKQGYIVLASDLRGHGKTAEDGKLGYDEDIYPNTIKDQEIICEYLDKKYHLPIYIFGHSYGSFLTQTFMQQCHIPKKFIVCGTSNGSELQYPLGSMLADIICALGNKDKKATILEKMSVGGYGKKFENGNWLSRDEKNWENYKKDKYCGGSFPFSFYRSMFKSFKKVNKGIKNIDNDAKIMLIAGSKDPVGANAKHVKHLYKKYKKANLNVIMKIYEGARHELLNETNKKEVYEDVAEFLEK